MRRPARLLCAALLALSLGSCGLMGDFSTMLRGNARHRSGRYEEAAAAYLSLRRGAWQAIVDFNLANTWSRLGETKAALALYVAALREGDPRLRRDAAYNRGVLHFESGSYEDAWMDFREALRLDSRDEEARRNLELAWRAWQKEDRAPPSGLSQATRGEARGSSEELRLLRRLETGAWHPGSTSDPGAAERDY